jgi:uncharacterized membrane protein (UPF0182 family)
MKLRLSLLLILGVVLLLGLPSTALFYTDWLWFTEVGQTAVFLTTLNAEVTVFAAAFAASFLFLYANFRVARLAVQQPHLVLGGAGGRTPPIVIETRRIGSLSTIVALAVALLFGYVSSNTWLDWLSYLKAVPFGTVDPLFHRDVAFYVFQLPVYDDVRQGALLLSFLAVAACGLLYLLSGKVVLESRYGFAFWPRVRLAPTARRHLGILAALIFGLMAWGAWLDIPRMLIAPANVIFGASYANVHADLPFLRLTIVVLVMGGMLSLWHGFVGRGWAIPAAVALYLVVTVSGGLYSGFVQKFSVTPNELDKERPFILYNIAATRQAYALDHVEERPLSGDAELTAKDIAANADTIQNVRLWDHDPLLQTFAQIQKIRPYYEFDSVDNDRYTIDNKYRQVMLSVRELNSESLPNRTWVNEHLTYTHGYGLTLGPVNLVTTGGLPELFIKDLPPVTTVNVDLPITEPSIYFGELTKSYALVKTHQPEFDYPHGDNNVTTTYHGTGGVTVGGFFRRLLFALRFGSTDILVTRELAPDSRVLFHREIKDRIQMIAPFLEFDADPYPVVSDGRIFWMQDAYTTTANYPYSTPVDGINYIRNSVKIVIDAYNGGLTFYLAEPSDPIARTIDNIFPGLLRPMSEMPAGLQKHVRYPEHIFAVQATVFATYHMTNPTVFYNKEDQWQVPVLDTESNPRPMEPYYTVTKLPGETKTEFIQMLPFTPRLNNLSAWLVARSDGANYGHLLSFQFPKQKMVKGPRQIVGLINQDQTISPQITLWDQQGSKVIWGTLLVIPIEESLLYVRPLYLRAAEGGIPELKRVIVAYQNQIVMEQTLTEALIKIFGPSIAAALPPDRLQVSDTPTLIAAPGAPAIATPAAGVDVSSLADLVSQALDHHNRMMKAARDGDWALFGEENKKLDDVLQRMSKIKK